MAQQAYIEPSHIEASDFFGRPVTIDGDVLAVTAIGEDSTSTGVNGDQMNNGATGSGAVYVFRRIGTAWSREAYIKASNTDADDASGAVIALSRDMLVVGSPSEASISSGVDGTANPLDNSAFSANAVYVFQ